MSSLGKEIIKAKREPGVWAKQRNIETRKPNEIKIQEGESMARNLWSRVGG